MLKYTNNKEQIDSIISSMHYQIQDLVRAEVGERRDKDQETIEMNEVKGLFKIQVHPQIEHLMKLSKSIFDKTDRDKQLEEEAEKREIEQNFPTYREDFDRDRLEDVNEDEELEQDYEEPEGEQYSRSMNSFRNLTEKKKSFYKLLKTYQALLQKRNFIINEHDQIRTMSESNIFKEKFEEISEMIKIMYSKQSIGKFEQSLTNTETKILNLRIRKCLDALIAESKMSETKVTLKVTSKDFPDNYNFYEDPYFTEIKLVYAPLIKIGNLCEELLEERGEHPLLEDLVLYCKKMLSFHCYMTPLQKILTGLEIILQKMAGYLSVCAYNKHETTKRLQDQVNTCKLLIIRFRKIQITSWKQMMNSKLEKALVEDYDNFIHLTYALNTEVIKTEDIEYDKIFDAVDMYIRDSNLSQFNNRLLHLNILRDQMDAIGRKGVSNVIHFVYMYYCQLKDKHKEIMKTLQNETETKIKTLIDVSKWSVQKFETSTVGRAYKQLNRALNKYSRCVLEQNITNSVLSKSREEVIGQYQNRASGTRNEFADILREPVSLINKDIHKKLQNNDLVKRLRHVAKHQVFEKWIDVYYIETKNTEMINKILDEWDKKQSSQRRDLSELFRFLKSQDLSANYQRVIEANRTSKYVTYEDVNFLYCHPTLQISDSMRYVLSKNELYFYKNFEMLLILSSSYQVNPSIRNNEISAMRNFTGSLYYKLLSYSKNLNVIIDQVKDFMSPTQTLSDSRRFKHSVILEQFKNEAEEADKVSSYNILSLSDTKIIFNDLIKILEQVNCVLSVDVQLEIDYYQQIQGCIVTAEKAQTIKLKLVDVSNKINSDYKSLCYEYDENIVVDLLNKLNRISQRIENCPRQNTDEVNEKVIELYKKRLMLLYQSFSKFEHPTESTSNSKDGDKEKEPGMDEHIARLQVISTTLSENLEHLRKLENTACKSGSVEVSVLAYDAHIFLLKMIERSIRYQKSMCKLLYIILSLFIHLTYNGFCGEEDQEHEGDDEDDKDGKFEFNDGTGMGEGKGMQNVSDQIEHEEQLEGLKDEQGDPDEEPDEKEDKEDKAFDMKNDFDGENEEVPKNEDENKEEEEVDSQDLDDEMDDVDNKLDNELFNEDNEISSESDNDDDKPEEDSNKPPVDLDKQVDLDQKDNEAKGNDENNDAPEQDKDKPNDQNETEMKPEEQNDINEQQENQDKPYVNIDEQIKEDPEQEEEKDQEDQKEDMEPEEGSEENDEEMSQEGDHQFDPTKEDENGKEQEQEEEQEQNEFDIEDLENMEGDDGANEQEELEDQGDSEHMEDEDNPDKDVEAKPEQKPDEEDDAMNSQVQNQDKQDNNATGTNQQKGQKEEEKNDQENPNEEEKRDYNTEENDLLFQLMQQFLEQKNQEDQKKPKEGERNEDPNMKKADNIEELDDMPDEAPNQDDNEMDGQDFAKDDKSKDIRSNVADTVKYNDEDMQPNEEEKQEEPEDCAPDDKQEEDNMSVDDDKNLDEVKDNNPIKSMIKTNEFYQKYLEDKNKKKEEEKKEDMDVEQAKNEEEANQKNDDKPMHREDEEDRFELVKQEYKLDTSEVDVLELRKFMIQRYEAWRKDKDLVLNSYELLNKFKKTTQHLSISLCEQMRMILEPTEKSRLKGDYKSGKRINIKKIIPFIASNYRNDKIWLRREMPFKRDYRVMIAIDDSLSMKRNNLGFFALESLVAISEALNQLNVGKVCVCGINERMNMHMSFEDTYSAEKAAFILSNYSFEYQSYASADTSIPNFMSDCNKLLDSQKTDNRNIVFIISDGRFNKKKCLPYIMEAEDKKYLYVFIVLDNCGIESKNSIFNMKSAELVTDEQGKTDYKINRYLDDFPFKYYTIVQEISHLPKVLSNIFLQWLAMMNS